MFTPHFLELRDTIGIISTARKITTLELQPLIHLIESWGLKYVLGKTIDNESDQFAGDDATRALDFQTMIDNPKVKAIWCARGGYGTIRILDQIDFSGFIKNPKWIIGYSDVTVLHAHFHSLGIETLHANMAIDINTKTEETRKSINKVLFGKEYKITFASEHVLNRKGVTNGQLVGGNLSILYSLIGSSSELITEGKILFLEDLDEMLYHIDRMMHSLKRSGALENLKGLVVGGMNDMKDNVISFGRTAEEIVLDAVVDYSYPVCFNFPCGHINDNRALILGREVQLKVDKNEVTLGFNLI